MVCRAWSVNQAKKWTRTKMPIYEYQCDACEHKFEKLQKISDDPLKDCPACNEPKLNKLVSAAAFRLKGGGWYETDFKTGKKKNVSGSDSSSSGSSSSSGTSSSSSSDSKSAASS
jgi:putative FmdB family regulatory protein